MNALQYLHKNSIAHGDLNLTNILINPQTLEVKIIDFGLSKIKSSIDSLSPLQGNQSFRLPAAMMCGNVFVADIWGLALIIISIFSRKKITTNQAIRLIEIDSENKTLNKIFRFLKLMMIVEEKDNFTIALFMTAF